MKAAYPFFPADWKYLIAYTAPLAAFGGIYFGGIWSPGSIYVGFVLIPILEGWLGGSPHNPDPEESTRRNHRSLFDYLLYLNIPILYGLLLFFGWRVTTSTLTSAEWVGMLFNVGLIVGICGINVGHELGHRSRKFERWMAWVLLLPALYMHFYIEHNRGHHRWVATEHDPATASKNEWLYTFWWRSIWGGYLNAWRLEKERLQKANHSFWSGHNLMLKFQVVQVIYLLLWYLALGWTGLGIALAVALVGVLLLESINYIEHYGLRRKKDPQGHYEPVYPHHSWNSDHHLGRIFLYELTRHSDHHYRASRKYQILRHFDASPQLPYGYPSSILLALIPPLWFRLMNPLTELWNERFQHPSQ